MRRNTIKCVEFGQLAKWKRIFEIRSQIEVQFSEIDSDPLGNTLDEIVNLFHIKPDPLYFSSRFFL